MIKLLSRSVIALTLILSFAPTVRPINVSESNNNLYAQATTTKPEKLANANRLFKEGYELFQQGTKESFLQALEKWQEALPLFQATNKSLEEATTLFLIGKVYDLLGEKKKALDYFSPALPIFQAVGDRRSEATTLNHIGSVYDLLGEKEKALLYFNQALAIFQTVGDTSSEATTLNYLGLLYNSLGEKEKALSYFNQALSLSLAAGDRRSEATALNNLGLVYDSLGEKQKALDSYKQALPIFQSLEDPRSEALVFNNLGRVYDDLGEKEKALDYYKQALPIFRRFGDRISEALIFNNLGLVYDDLGEKQEALDSYKQALAIFQAVGNRGNEATTLNNIGYVYYSLGEKQEALDYYNQALPIHRSISDRNSEANTLNNLGLVYSSIGEQQKALNYYNQSLAILQAVGDRRGEATTLSNIGYVYDSLGEKQKALEYYNQTLPIRKAVGDRSGEATTLNNLGLVYSSIGEQQKALDYFNQALGIFKAVGEQVGQATILSNIGFIYYEKESYSIALQTIDRAIEIVEQIRNKIFDNDLKTSYFSTVEKYYKLKTEILMQLHQQNPNQSYDILAFENSEQGKARSLLELLQEANINIRQGVTPELVTKEKSLQNQLDAVEKRRISLCSKNCSERQINKLETERSKLLEQYKTIQAKIRAISPEYAELTQPEPIQLKELQQILDEDTILWQYSLWQDRSYIWVITKNSLTTHEIASRKEIESVAREYHKLLQYESRDKKLNSVATKLSQLITPPIAKARQKSRIVIVSDGALQYIPFATLPLKNNQSLLTNHQIINLPSSSVLARLRTNQTRKNSAKKQLAILADPIFSKSDPRLPQQQIDDTADLGYDPLRSATRSSDLQLSRLVGTKKEAETIVAYIPKSQQTSVFDFDANLQFATSHELSNYNIIHFATHGILNSEQPELSGIVLSLFDEQGKPQNGFLRLHEVFNLNLTADLVVLSACQTGLGKEIRGEGLVGLTRGFMYAGATRVLVSLWSVDDLATAEFMSKFYSFMLQDNLTPAAALNATQNGSYAKQLFSQKRDR